MKAAPFEYSRATDIDEACALLAADDSARVIAGGQTLVPMMAMRLARPTRLIDINRIAALSYIRNDGDGVAIGATTRQCVIERDALVASQVPLLARAIPNIGHAATRARGTIGGSLANADPAAELSLVARDARRHLELSRRRQDRRYSGARLSCRSDGHQPAGGRLPDRRALSGLAGRKNRHRLSRGKCAQQRFCLRVGGGADRA